MAAYRHLRRDWKLKWEAEQKPREDNQQQNEEQPLQQQQQDQSHPQNQEDNIQGVDVESEGGNANDKQGNPQAPSPFDCTVPIPKQRRTQKGIGRDSNSQDGMGRGRGNTGQDGRGRGKGNTTEDGKGGSRTKDITTKGKTQGGATESIGSDANEDQGNPQMPSFLDHPGQITKRQRTRNVRERGTTNQVGRGRGRGNTSQDGKGRGKGNTNQDGNGGGRGGARTMGNDNKNEWPTQKCSGKGKTNHHAQLDGEEALVALAHQMMERLGSKTNFAIGTKKVLADLRSLLSTILMISADDVHGVGDIEERLNVVQDKVMSWEASSPDEAIGYSMEKFRSNQGKTFQVGKDRGRSGGNTKGKGPEGQAGSNLDEVGRKRAQAKNVGHISQGCKGKSLQKQGEDSDSENDDPSFFVRTS